MESVIVVIVVVLLTVISRVRQAQRKSKRPFKVPTPKSWQLPAPAPGNVIQRLQGNQPVPTPPAPSGPVPAAGFVPRRPATWVPAPTAPAMPGQVRQPAQQRLPHHRPQPHQLPVPQGDLDNRVRELMASGQEVAAVRLLCDEADLGIVEAQEYARSLAGTSQSSGRAATQEPAPRPAVEEPAWTGSAAFATSLFERDDENVWASGWVDTPEPEDRTDIEELWRTVRDAATPQQDR
jgi:hypothetical protein